MSAFIIKILLPDCIKDFWLKTVSSPEFNFSLIETHLPAWIVESMCKNLGRLVCAIKMWVAPWYGIRDIAQVSIYIKAQYRTCKITEKDGG